MIDKFFLRKFENIVKYERVVTENAFDAVTLYEAKRMGFSDVAIAKHWHANEQEVYAFVKNMGLYLSIKKLIHVLANLNQTHLIFTERMKKRTSRFKRTRKASSF